MNYKVIELTSDWLTQIVNINRLTSAGNWSSDQFLDELFNENSTKIGVIGGTDRQKGILLAFLFARLITHNTSDIFPDEVELLLISTSPDHQKKGLGKLLLKSLMAVLEDRAEIFLEVRKNNHQAIRFYKNREFKIVGERRNYYQNPSEAAVLMRLIKTNENLIKNNNT